MLCMQGRTTVRTLRENCMTSATRVRDNWLRLPDTNIAINFDYFHKPIIALAFDRFVHD